MTATPWLDEMESRLGVQEVRGPKANPVIIGWFKDIGHDEVQSDETSWCAVTVGSCLKSCSLPTTPRDVNMLARSYLTYGIACEPKRGAIAVWSRGTSTWQGHVNIVEDVRVVDGQRQVRCIGGNQGGMSGGDAVTRSPWKNAEEALAFRWPVAATVKDLRKAGSTEIKHADTLETAAAVTSSVGAAAAAVKESLPSVPDTVPLPPLIPEGASESISAFQYVMEGFNALAKVVLGNPWLAAIFVLSLGGVWVARVWKSGRLNRHILGYALSLQAQGGGDA